MAKKIVKYDVLIKSTKQTKQFEIPKFYTNDLNSVVFQFVVSDLTAEEQAAATAITMIYMRDGSFFQNPPTDVDKVGNTFSYTLKENEGNHAGIAKIQLVVNISGMPAVEYASQLYEFDIVNGLETKVAQEIMIYDWTTLTRDAQAYIDQFNLNETTRQQQFSDAQAQRTTDFGAAQTQRTTDFNTAEQSRTTAFNAAESARAEGYTADHGRAETDHTTAAADHTTAGTDHTLAASDHTLAASDHTTAAADHTIVQGYNTRLTTVEGDISTHKANTANPHGVTKAQVGLGNVDNTSDANKPVSTAQQTALNAKANKVQEAWITPTLTSGWVAYSADLTPGYYKDEFGIVHLKGVVKNGVMGDSVFTLPLLYRPSKNKYFITCGDSNFSLVNVIRSGQIQFTVPQGTGFRSLDGITFKAEE